MITHEEARKEAHVRQLKVQQYITQQEQLERDVKRYFELAHNPTSNTNPNEIRPYIEWANELMELEKQILLKVGAKDV